mgnify:CR=1 FL=1
MPTACNGRFSRSGWITVRPETVARAILHAATHVERDIYVGAAGKVFEELVLLVWYEKAWPDSRGIRIVLAERKASLTDPGCNEQFPDEGAPKWNASGISTPSTNTLESRGDMPRSTMPPNENGMRAAAGRIVMARRASFIAPGVVATSFADIVYSSGLLSSGALPVTSISSPPAGSSRTTSVRCAGIVCEA